MKQLTCAIETAAITVGQKIKLLCDLPTTVDPKTVQYIDSENHQPFTIKFLGQPTINGGKLEQLVTSYRVGDNNFNKVIIKAGNDEYLVSPFGLKVQSVVEQPSPTPFPIV